MNNCFNHFSQNNNTTDGEPRMTSLEIATLTGKPHNDVLKAIRKMEPAWEKVQGGKFSLLQKTYDLPNSGKKMMPYYSLTKTETLAYRMMTLRVLPSAVRMIFRPLRADDERWPLMEYHPAADASASTRLMPVGSMLKKSFHVSATL